MKTSVARLRAVAEEIVGALPTAAAVVEVQDVEPTLDPCVYDGASIAALFNAQQGETLAAKPYLPTSSCKYQGYVGNTQIEVSMMFSGDPLRPSHNMDPEYIVIDGFGTDVYMKDTSRTAGYETSRRAYEIARPGGHIMVFFTVGEETFPADAAERILNNLIARTN